MVVVVAVVVVAAAVVDGGVCVCVETLRVNVCVRGCVGAFMCMCSCVCPFMFDM